MSSVSLKELREFADTLFSHLYSHLDLQKGQKTTSKYFKDIIATVILCIGRTTREFNSQFINASTFIINPVKLCDMVCSSYPNDDYFKKLYYASAFISNYMYWYAKFAQTTDLGMGPFLWIEMFRMNFKIQFEHHGGWQGFADAGEAILEFFNSHRNEPCWRTNILPDSFIEGISKQFPRIPESPVEKMSSYFEELKLHNLNPLPSTAFFEEEEYEGDQQMQVDQELNPPPVPLEENRRIENPSEGTSEEMGSIPPPNLITQLSHVREHQQKRRRSGDANDSDMELDLEHADKELSPLPVSPAKKKIQIVSPLKGGSEKLGESLKKTPRKRKLDSATKDSDEELDFPSSSKAKVEKK